MFLCEVCTVDRVRVTTLHVFIDCLTYLILQRCIFVTKFPNATLEASCTVGVRVITRGD
jgi:hypothetical protein